jgi:hypothetical protein
LGNISSGLEARLRFSESVAHQKIQLGYCSCKERVRPTTSGFPNAQNLSGFKCDIILYMTPHFKKFIFIITSLILSWLTIYGLNWLYFNIIVSPGDTFGGEAIFLLPIGIVCIFLYYFLLKRIFGKNSSPNPLP